MSKPRNTVLALTTSYNGSEQPIRSGLRRIEWGCDDAAIGFTLRIRDEESIDNEIPVAAGQSYWEEAPSGGNLEGFTWNAKADSGTPNLWVREIVG